MSPSLKEIRPAFVLEVCGIDFTRSAAEQPVDVFRSAAGTHGVVVFRNDRTLTDDQHVRFSRIFGPIEIGPAFKIQGDTKPRIVDPALVDVSNLDPDGNIMALDNRRRLFAKGNQLWHTDMSFMENRATYSLLAAHEIPPAGANTEFADMAAAYEALPPALQSMIEDLIVEHSIWHSRRLAGFPEPTTEELLSQLPVRHRLVHVHPGSHRKVLYLAAHASHIVGWPYDLGRGLLKSLMKFATQPQFVYSHEWRVGDLLMWDNMSTMHRATEFDDTKYRRDMRRTTCRERPAEPAVAA